ncbi:hypothetical protein PVNG_04909 [Plasmodium vivax North Korean]|uniref:Variable surface protein n=1 Tax=Plasmodium vivax North Korean TaxID=1035514 RepID=A0A0J9TZ17_PLAVI|nr:hypothetical protein PVNG_04909 [Plasmodium vivax North Korean]
MLIFSIFIYNIILEILTCGCIFFIILFEVIFKILFRHNNKCFLIKKTYLYLIKKFQSLYEKYDHIFEICAKDDNIETYSHCSDYEQMFKGIDHNGCSNLNKACPIITKYIKQLEESSENVTEGCIYLYYYMHGKFIVNKSSCNILAIYKKLLQAYCDANAGKKCNDLLAHINNYDFVKMKKLMDQHSSFFDRTYKDDSNCEYAKECAESYEQYIKDCYGFVNSYYCNELKNFKYDYEDKMKEAKCPGVPNILTSAEVIDLQYFVVIPVSTILVICFISFILCKVNNNKYILYIKH